MPTQAHIAQHNSILQHVHFLSKPGFTLDDDFVAATGVMHCLACHSSVVFLVIDDTPH